ncbi:MFS general substrate transporter [Dacryopinax primogenitus]|uniref:MFS general substrate transporter n=1 Tax=Dacryopinax primogenitus (strain DJM 731) TaxID=1858805 RepID=M5GBX1_DACPD|nr:MFS general substrate transporter [Dacryopinax primogenitus]EJU03572.1 MFS general substrate transporter [Dacryopinax primogenitus]
MTVAASTSATTLVPPPAIATQVPAVPTASGDAGETQAHRPMQERRHSVDGFALTDRAHVHEPIDPRIHELPSNEEVAQGLFHHHPHHARHAHAHHQHEQQAHDQGKIQEEQEETKRPESRATATAVPPAVTEKGLESGLSDETVDEDVIYVEYEKGDPRNPFNFSRTRKWAMTAVLVSFTALTAATGSAYAMGYNTMERDLGCSQELAALGLSMYALGFGLAPLVLASFSEEFGRLPMYLVSTAIFALFFIPMAVAKNIQTVLVSRFIQGMAGSTGSTLVGGTLADIWVTAERGIPMSLFALMACLMTGLGPVTVGYVDMNPHLEWRWIQWLGLIFGGACFAFMCIVMKETRASILLTREAAKLRKETGDNRYRARVEDERTSLKTLIYISFTRPLFLLITEPVVASFSLWVGFAWGMLYCLLESVPYVFQTIYGFNTGELGLAFISMVVGTLIGWAFNLFVQERLYRRNVGRIGAEARLYSACLAGIMFPIGAFIYAWTSYPQVHWIAPVIGVTIITTAVFLVYLAVFSYLADAYLIFASSALAGQSLCRNLAATAFPLFTFSMYERLTPQWASTLIALLASLLGVIPFILFFCGAKIRERSRFAKMLAATIENS